MKNHYLPVTSLVIMIFLSACSYLSPVAGLKTTVTETAMPTQTAYPTDTPSEIAQTKTGFGREAVWNIDDSISKYQNCFNNSSTSMECVVALMQTSGASSQAVAFTKVLQGIAFMSSFTEYGVVDLAEITYPVRANNNVEYVLVNGNPQMVYVEDGYKVDITQNPNYSALRKIYPNLQIEGGENSFENKEQISQGGQRFIFSFELVDGCHACQINKSAYIAFDFDGIGQFEEMTLLYIK